MVRSLFKKTLILSFCFFCYACSDNQEEKKVIEAYLPFPPKSQERLSNKDLKRIDLKYFSKIEPGEFLMGSPLDEPGRGKNEKQHKVKISNPYFMGKFEVTVKEWNQVLGDFAKKEIRFIVPKEHEKLLNWFYEKREKPEFKRLSKFANIEKLNDFFSVIENFRSKPKTVFSITSAQLGSVLAILTRLKPEQKLIQGSTPEDVDLKIGGLRSLWSEKMNLPVTDVSYSQALQFCFTKTTESHETGALPKGMIFRLPTEAEWEFACRAGTNGVCGLDDGNDLSGVNANINGGSRGNIIGKPNLLIYRKKLTSVSRDQPSLKGNEWGLHDMHGNVMEWCYDFYGEYPDVSISIDPIGPIRGAKRVLRGGSFLRPAHSARSAARESLEPSWRGSEIGFRIVLAYPLR